MSSKMPGPLMRCPDPRPVLSNAVQSTPASLFTNNCTYMPETLSPPTLPNLPPEIVQQIFLNCPDITSVVNLSATSHQFRQAYLSSQKLRIIENALESQFGPLYDAIQIVVHNQSQPVYLAPEPPMSMALAKQISRVGYVAQSWEQMYPMLRWRDAPEYRRLLRPHEARRFRRALYRIWLYSKAFHNEDFLQLGLPGPWQAHHDDARLEYFRLFGHDEMQEIRELNFVFQSMVNNDLCPSDAIIQHRYNEGFPGEPPLYFGCYHTHLVDCFDKKCFCRRLMLRHDLPQSWVAEAWGPRDTQVYTVRKLLKLEPDKLLYFKEQLDNRSERLAYLATLPEWFHQYQSTVEEAMSCVYVTSNDVSSGGGVIDYSGMEPEELSANWQSSVDYMLRPKDWAPDHINQPGGSAYSHYSFRESFDMEVEGEDEDEWEAERDFLEY